MRMVLCAFCKIREAHFYEHGVPVCRDCLDITLWHEADLYRIVRGARSPTASVQVAGPAPETISRAIMEAMKIDVSDEELKLITEALEHYYAYTRAAQRDSRYQELADRLKESASPEDAPVQRISPKRKR